MAPFFGQQKGCAYEGRRPRRGPPAVFPLAAGLGLSGCQSAVLNPQGPVGSAEAQILFDAIAIMLTIVVPTLIATVAFAWWFRASNTQAKRRPDWTYSGRLELVVWSVPLLTVMFLGGLAWISSHDLDPAQPLAAKSAPLDVQVVSLDWKWLFIYPQQQIASVNELVAPAGSPVHFTLTSASVMNAFFVPQLGSMIYTMNGMATQLNLQADRPGVYAGLSSHFSGDGFAGMHFDVRATTPEQFAAWVAATRARGPQLDPQSYAALARQSANVAPFAYRSVSPGLFQAIATQKIVQAPGPDSKGASARISPKPER
jgi:cytochrome o ubiquinol oxidase subunit 2